MNVRTILLVLSVIAFAIGAVRPGLAGIGWTDAGLALAVASLLV